MSNTYNSICQPGNCVPSRQQRDITLPSLGSNTANQAEVSGDGSKTLLSLQQMDKVDTFDWLILTHDSKQVTILRE
jgi:hypothetical protein